MRLLKNLFLFLLLVAVIAGSFWVSFLMGKNILSPVKKVPTIDLITSEANTMDEIARITFEVQSLTLEGAAPKGEKISAKKTESSEEYMKPKISHKRTLAPAVEQKISFAYKIQTGLFASRSNAQALVKSLKKQGYEAQSEISGKYTKVFVPAETLSSAKKIARDLRAKGFEAVVRRK